VQRVELRFEGDVEGSPHTPSFPLRADRFPIPRLGIGRRARRAEVPGVQSVETGGGGSAGRRSSWHLTRIRPLECLRPSLPLVTRGFYHSTWTLPSL
jgi:hypothetical protein